MKRRIRAFIIWLCTFAVGWTVLAQTGGGYNLTWSTLEGGTVSSGGAYTLRGVIAQPDSGKLTGDVYNLHGGFLNLPVSKVVSAPGAAPDRNYFTTAPITLTWSGVTYAQGYQVEVDDNRDFSSPVYQTNLPANARSVTITPPFNGQFFWHVRAKVNANTWSGWSEIDSFTVYIP